MKKEESSAPVRPFADILRDLGNGFVADEASVALTDLVRHVVETGKKGTVEIRVEVEPFKGSVHTLMVSARVKSRLPEAEPVASVFFPDETGNLHRNDPKQEMLPLRNVARPDAELRGSSA